MPTPSDPFYRMQDVERVTGLKKSTLYLMIKRGDFPKAMQLSKRCVAWPRSVIDAWTTSRTVVDMNVPKSPSAFAKAPSASPPGRLHLATQLLAAVIGRLDEVGGHSANRQCAAIAVDLLEALETELQSRAAA
jgi:prophage regulatory protein